MVTCQINEKGFGISCPHPALESDPDSLCILHSSLADKDDAAFKAAMQEKLSQGDSNFRAVFFPAKVSFSGQKLLEADFVRARFYDKADFQGATFSHKANFSATIFQKAANFSEATFTEGANFIEATFAEGAVFSKTTFTREADFFNVTFTKEADFNNAIFEGSADFLGATFNNKANFFWATFKNGGNFVNATFNEVAIFIKATFKGRFDFSETKFKGEADFGGIFNEGQLLFSSNSMREGTFVFHEMGSQGRMFFQDMSLSQVQFRGTNLRQAEFQHVHWHPYRGRQAVYDEVSLRQQEKDKPWFWDWFGAWLSNHFPLKGFALEIGPALGCYLTEANPHPEPPWGDRYGEVERLYRDLQESYEQARDYKKMGDFHYGEMEMHRRASKWRWFPCYWYNLYRFLSGYGERPSWALGWLAAFLVGMATIVWWLGLEVGKPPHAYMAGFGDSFIYLLQKVTLQRPDWAEPVGFGGKLAAGLSVLFIPGQAALFLLALRNRLGRRR